MEFRAMKNYIGSGEVYAVSEPIPQMIQVLPVPHLVVFPRTHLSLHIPRRFFDRIRLAPATRNLYLGILLREGHSPDSEGVRPIGCVGRIIRVYDLACGRAVHLDLHGLKRFRLLERWFDEGVGPALIEIIEDQPAELNSRRTETLRGILRETEPVRDPIAKSRYLLSHTLEDEAFINQVCLESSLSPDEKYFLLEADNLNQRCGRLLDLLRFRHTDLRSDPDTCQKGR